MATITPTQSLILPTDNIGDATVDGWKVTWGPMQNGDVGAPVQFAGYADKSFQATGTAGTGGSISCEGSNDGANFAVLTVPAGTAATLTSSTLPGIMAITEATIQVRPHVTAGDGTTSLTVTMFFRKTQSNMK